MNHYFSEKPNSVSEPKTFKVHIFNQTFTFKSDVGVFSKDHLDFASRLLVENVQLKPDQEVLDLGCGVGVIGLLLKSQVDIKLTMVDVNERAIELANRNFQSLNFKAKVIKSDGFSALKKTKFDHIVTNPPIRIGKKSLYEMLETATHHLHEDGALWVVMHKKHGAESLIHFMEQNHKVETVIRKKGFKLLKILNSN